MNKLLGNGSGPRDISRDIWAKSIGSITNCFEYCREIFAEINI